jgi:hypothetical protein
MQRIRFRAVGLLLTLLLLVASALPAAVGASHCEVYASRPTSNASYVYGGGFYRCYDGAYKQLTVRLQRYNTATNTWYTYTSSSTPRTTNPTMGSYPSTSCVSGYWRSVSILTHSYPAHSETVTSSAHYTYCG